MLLSDNAIIYSSPIFHVAVFDIVKSHGYKLVNLIHNKSQNSKTELDLAFFNFKDQLYKYVSVTKSSVLTLSNILQAMKYGKE